MTVFVAYGYRAGELWVRDLIVPMLSNLGVRATGGEEIPGTPIDPGIRARIGQADALIGFLLRRERSPDGTYTTSDYVRQEIEIAHAAGKDVIQVVETDVRAPGGFLGSIQHLAYDSHTRDQFLLQLSTHVKTWVDGEVYVRLQPQELLRDIEASTVHPAACAYTIIRDGHPGSPRQARILFLGGGMYIKLLGFGPGTFADVTIKANNQVWFRQGMPHALPFVQVELSQVELSQGV